MIEEELWLIETTGIARLSKSSVQTGARSAEYGKAGPCFCSQLAVPGVANTTPHPPCSCAMVTACSSSPLKLAHPLTPTGTITCSPTLKSPSRSGPKPTKPLPRLLPVKSGTGFMPNKRNCTLSSPITRGRRPGRSQWSHWNAKKTKGLEPKQACSSHGFLTRE